MFNRNVHIVVFRTTLILFCATGRRFDPSRDSYLDRLDRYLSRLSCVE